MKIYNFLFGLVLFGIIGATSCDVADEINDIKCAAFSIEYVAIGLDVQNAVTAWDEDPTPATCQDLVDAYTDAVNATQKFVDGDCVPDDQVDGVKAAITAWNVAKNALDCSSVGT